MIRFDYKNKPFDNTLHLCSPARTLCPSIVGNNESGWIVKAEVHEDYYEWVSYFEAFHPDFGIVFGDFEDVVFASSKEALKDFLSHFPYEEWDYYDI